MPANQQPGEEKQTKPVLPDEHLLALLVCPLTKEPLVLKNNGPDATPELVSVAAHIAYPIRDGIPIMLEEEARLLTEEERQAYKNI